MRILRGLAGRVLPCGCFVGVYETYSNGVVATIDVCGGECRDADHQLHQVVELPPAPSPAHALPSARSM